TGSNAKDNITMNLGGKTFTCNLFIKSVNGKDTVTVTGAGTVGCNITVLSGLGNDSVAVSLGQIGGATQAFSQAGNDTFSIGTGAAKSGGDVSVTGFQASAAGTSAGTFGGSVAVNDFLLDTGTAGTTDAGVVFGNDLTVTTGAVADTVTLTAGTVNGNLT